MKSIRVLSGAVVMLMLLLPCGSMADPWKNESGKSHPGKPGFHKEGRDHGRGRDDRGPDRDRGPRYDRDYRDHRGYRERPHDRGRHYGHYKHNGHRYEYCGHWRSWDDFDRYARRYPHIYRHGRYYREQAHLMFRFCEPGSGGCFFFSIGR